MEKAGRAGARRVYMVGIGPMGVQQLTLETVALLRSCDIVFITAVLENQKLAWQDLRSLASFGIRVETGTKLRWPPENEVRQMLDAAGGAKTIGVICQGNPAFFGHSFTFHKLFAEAGYDCVHVAALSSFDCVITALQSVGVLNSEAGFQLYFAQHLEPGRFRPSPHLATLIYRLEVMRSLERPRFKRLMKRLVLHYPPRHTAVLVRCEPDGEECRFVAIADLHKCSLEDKDGFFGEGNLTVYIPPLSRPIAGTSLWNARPLREVEMVPHARLGGAPADLIRCRIGEGRFKRLWKRRSRPYSLPRLPFPAPGRVKS